MGSRIIRTGAILGATIAVHRRTWAGHLRDGAYGVAMPGTIATLVTTLAGAVMFRRRPTP